MRLVSMLLCVAALFSSPTAIADDRPWAEVADLHGTGNQVYERLGRLAVEERSLVLMVLAYDLYEFRRLDDGRYAVTVYNCGQWGEKDLLGVRTALDRALAYKPAGTSAADAVRSVFEGKKGSPPTAFSDVLDAPEDLRGFYDYAGKFSSNSLMEEPGRTEVTVYLLD